MLLFPLSCRECGESLPHAGLGGTCAACWRGAHWLQGGAARRQGATVAGAYSGSLRRAIHAYKFAGRTQYLRPFASLLQELAPAGAAAVAFPPSTRASRLQKGFDPALELASRLAGRLKLPLLKLKRKKEGPRQATLGRARRLKNVKGAFAASIPKALKGGEILLVDDVLTTGATLGEAALALRIAGAGAVRPLALAAAL
jgi:predicted amidophosphoribosyltransferase